MGLLLRFVRVTAVIGLLVASLVCNAQKGAAPTWGSYQKPFSARSLWNARPVEPTLGSATIPPSIFNPAVQAGAYSTGIFLAKPTDPTDTVYPIAGAKGVYDADAEDQLPSVLIRHWPKDLTPASGTDGHADIVDVEQGVIHSFFKLKRVDGRWQAQQYAWSRLDGRGWGEPGHYFQGARAAGVPPSAGLIRTHELDDGDSIYRHALAISLDASGLAPSPTYVYPATSSDTNAASVNTGAIPMGSRLMLPPDFDTRSIANKKLKKIADTLKTYGGYVVDRNHGTPFLIYVELNPKFSLYDAHSTKDETIRDLDRIRMSLRPMVNSKGWVDGNGEFFHDDPSGLNLISMRGPWKMLSGDKPGKYDTAKQSVDFPASDEQTVMMNPTKNIFGRLHWLKPRPGKKYRLSATSTGGANLKLVLQNCGDSSQSIVSPDLSDRDEFVFTWPEQMCRSQLIVRSGPGRASSISASLKQAITH